MMLVLAVGSGLVKTLEKIATTDRIAVIETVQAPVPLQPPPTHPLKEAPSPACAVSVTGVPLGWSVAQLGITQVVAGGLISTLPALVDPRRTTTRANCCDGAVKVAVTVVSAVSVSMQGPVPLQLPLHPVKVDPESGSAVRVSAVPWFRTCEQLPAQEIPVGLVTAPLPVPAFVMVRRTEPESGSNVAVTVFVLVRATVHCAPLTASHPLQPAKVEVAPGAAVKTTCAPPSNRAEQVEPQVIPPGVLVTVPDPLPARTTESTNVGEIVKVAVALNPPGSGFTTVTGTVPAEAISVAEIASSNRVALTNVGVRGWAFHKIVELGRKLFPLTVKVNASPPTSALLGEREVIEGTGLSAGVMATPAAPPPTPTAAITVLLAVSMTETDPPFVT